MYDYQATVVEWHDGDTVKLCIDQGFGNTITCWIRIIECWAAEMDTKEGQNVQAYCDQRWPADSTVWVTTRKPSADYAEFEGKQLGKSFARWLGAVYVSNGVGGKVRVNDILVKLGFATYERS